MKKTFTTVLGEIKEKNVDLNNLISDEKVEREINK